MESSGFRIERNPFAGIRCMNMSLVGSATGPTIRDEHESQPLSQGIAASGHLSAPSESLTVAPGADGNPCLSH
jgi:hypothetical protein